MQFKKLIGSSLLSFYLLLGTLLPVQQAGAVLGHLDIEVWGQGNALFAGFCRTPGIVGCDLDRLTEILSLPVGTLPRESATGKLIFLADFQDLAGGNSKTKNPGFQSVQNGLLPNELLGYRALGKLKYWDLASSTWNDAPPNVQILLFGGLEASTEVLNDFSSCAGQLICFSNGSFGVDGSTVFSGDGIHGSPELVVDITNTNGILHTHLSFSLEDQLNPGGGLVGAYLIEMQLISNARFFPSESFLILFNAGLSEDEFAAALIALAGEPANINPPSQPPIIRLSIPGDVDLDSDVDRIDIALILLAVQNNEILKPENAAFDVDQDGAITRADAFLAKGLCTLRLCNIPVEAPATTLNIAAIYDHTTGILNLNDIQAGNQHYRAQLQLQPDHTLRLNLLQLDKPRYATPATYDVTTGTLIIPVIFINGKYFQVNLRNLSDSNFQLDHMQEISGILD